MAVVLEDDPLPGVPDPEPSMSDPMLMQPTEHNPPNVTFVPVRNESTDKATAENQAADHAADQSKVHMLTGPLKQVNILLNA